MHAAAHGSSPTGSPGTPAQPPTVALAGWLAATGSVGSLIMAFGHLDVGAFARLFGPGRLILPAAIGFSVGTLAFAAASFGLFARRRWGWMLAVAVNLAAGAVAAWPIRGWFSIVALAVAAAALVVLATPAVRAACLSRADNMQR